MKERITLTIDEDLLKKVDATVNQHTVKNRSHAVELLLRQVLRGNAPKKAVILAGGEGEQFLPLTEKMPKAMIPIDNKPLIEHNLELLRNHGVEKVFIALNQKGSAIKERYKDGKALGLEIKYIDEEEPLGTAGCLAKLKDELTEPFIMLNGDELKEIDLSRLYQAHNSYQSVATIALTTIKDPSKYGVAILDGNNILRFVEKPPAEEAPSRLINAGLYIFEPEVTKLVPEGFAMLEQDVFPMLAREGKLFGYPFSGKWSNLESPEDIEKVEKSWKKR